MTPLLWMVIMINGQTAIYANFPYFRDKLFLLPFLSIVFFSLQKYLTLNCLTRYILKDHSNNLKISVVNHYSQPGPTNPAFKLTREFFIMSEFIDRRKRSSFALKSKWIWWRSVKLEPKQWMIIRDKSQFLEQVTRVFN